MASAEIGALRVRLGMDAGEFKKGGKDAESAMDRLGSRFGGFAGMAEQHGRRVALAMVAAATSIGILIHRTLEGADSLNKLSQSLGISVENLSRLQYAARLSDVSAEDFRKAILQLTKSLNEAGTPMSEGARAFAALGISARDSAGNLRPANEVLAEMATKFAGYADGANKTAIALALLGRSGDRMIPMLNAGANGLRELGQESDALGATLSTRTARAAEEFNDTLTRIKVAGEALALNVTSRILPAFQSYADQMKGLSQETGLFKSISDAAVATISFFTQAVQGAIHFFSRFVAELRAGWELLRSLSTFDTSRIAEAWRAFQAEGARSFELQNELMRVNEIAWSGWVTTVTTAASAVPLAMAPVIQSAESMREALRKLKDEQLAALNDLTSDKTADATTKLIALGAAWRGGVINAQAYGRAVRQVNQDNAQNMDAMLSQTSTTLGAMFQNSKAVAIAQALINTYQGVTKSIAEYPPPISMIMAGLQLAAGMAQVANIQRTSKNSTGGGSTSAGSGGGAAAAAASAPESKPGQNANQTMTVQGFRADELWRGDNLKGLVSGLLDFQRDGGRVVLA